MPEDRKLNYRLLEDNEEYLVIDKAPGVNLHRNQHALSLVDVLHRDFQGGLFIWCIALMMQLPVLCS